MLRKIEYKIVYGIDELNSFTTIAIGWELHRWIHEEKGDIFVMRRECCAEVLEAEKAYYNTEFFQILNKKWDDLEWSVRTFGGLYNEFKCCKHPRNKELTTKFVGDLIQYSEAEILKINNLGRKSLNEIRAKLAEYNLELNTPLEKLKNWKRFEI